MVESVTWISGGGHSQYSLFAAISLGLYILAGKNRKYYWWSVISFLIALLFSEKAASFPGILLLYQLLFDRKRPWWELVPFFSLSSIWTYLNLRKVPARLGYLKEEFASGGKPASPWLQVPVAVASYLGLIFWPDKLTLYHSEVMVSPKVFSMMVGVTGLVIVTGLISFWQGLKGKEWAKQVCFWLGVFVIGLLPTLLPLGVSWVVAERYVYLGAVGVLVLVAYGSGRLMKKQGWYEAAVVIFTVMVMGLMIRTLVRNNDWRSADNLWLAGARTSPNSPQNNNNLGDYYGRHGDYEKAAYHFLKAAELRPGYADPIHNLGNVYFKQGKIKEAMEAYQLALKLKPKLWLSHQSLAGIYFENGNYAKAIEELEKALAIAPDEQRLLQLLAQVKAKQAAEER
jgi:tetratricopeptide (TPR) repeat protein